MLDDEPPPGVVVPDDPSELDADVRAYRRELRARRRHERLARWLPLRPAAPVPGPRRRRRLDALRGGPAILLAVLALGVVGTVVTAFLPRDPLTRPVSRRVPLATQASARTGEVGGLLPAAVLVADTGDVHAARDIRPSLVVVVPAACDEGCGHDVAALAGQAEAVGIDLVVAAPAGTDLGRLGRWAGTGPLVAHDRDGVLTGRYGDDGVTAVLVAGDGTVSRVQHHVTPDTHLEMLLHGLVAS